MAYWVRVNTKLWSGNSLVLPAIKALKHFPHLPTPMESFSSTRPVSETGWRRLRGAVMRWYWSLQGRRGGRLDGVLGKCRNERL